MLSYFWLSAPPQEAPIGVGAQGLGEIYEEEYVAASAAGAAVTDRDDKVRAEARALAKLLFGKLDALSHFHYAPKPVLEDLSVRADVPALAMEEVAPQVTRARPPHPHPVPAVQHGFVGLTWDVTHPGGSSPLCRK